jgi:hypothetical protein
LNNTTILERSNFSSESYLCLAKADSQESIHADISLAALFSAKLSAPTELFSGMALMMVLAISELPFGTAAKGSND